MKPRAPKQTYFSLEAKLTVPCRARFAYLKQITQPTLIVNGANEVMIATITSWPMVQNIHNAQLIVYPDVGHGAQFQYPDRFLKHSIQFQDA